MAESDLNEIPEHDIPSPRLSEDVVYDPLPKREAVRHRLAVGFSILLGSLTFGPLVLIATDVVTWSDIEDLMTLTFGSVVGIVGTVIGFYYGARAKGG